MVIMRVVLTILMTLDITRSMRLLTLPLHRMLVRLGFVDYVVSQGLKMAILEEHYKPVTETPTEELIPGVNQLIVSSDEDCELLLLSHWVEIIVNPGYCNSMTNDLVISNYTSLRRFTIKASVVSVTSGIN